MASLAMKRKCGVVTNGSQVNEMGVVIIFLFHRSCNVVCDVCLVETVSFKSVFSQTLSGIKNELA